MHQSEALRKLSDDDVAEILLSAGRSVRELAGAYKVSPSVVAKIVQRRTKRALIIARRLGLLPLSPSRVVWSGCKPTIQSDRVVRGRAQ